MSVVPTPGLPDSSASPLSALSPRGAETAHGIVPSDPKSVAAPIAYAAYGPFSSFAPCTDTARAILSHEDSMLLALTYGDVLGAAYAKSLEDFAAASGIPEHAHRYEEERKKERKMW